MASQTSLPYLSSDAPLNKYMSVPGSRWKYLRADYDDLVLNPRSVFLPKSNHPVRIEGGYYVASDECHSHRLDQALWRHGGFLPVRAGISYPMSIMVGTGCGASAGVLIQNAEALEGLERIDTLSQRPKLASWFPMFSGG